MLNMTFNIMSSAVGDEHDSDFGGDVSVAKMPAHWLMARLGKRVLRPGGRALTRWLVERARVTPHDDVVELAPGLGATAQALLAREPRSYVGVERDAAAHRALLRALEGRPVARIVRGDAARIPLDDGAASVVLGEAMLSMQPRHRKDTIIAEAGRVLRDGGRYAIHELALADDAISLAHAARIELDLSRAIRVGVRIETMQGWRERIERAGFVVEHVERAPMRLLELDRLIEDEGVAGAALFVARTLRDAAARARLLDVRKAFRAHEHALAAIAVVAVKRSASA